MSTNEILLKKKKKSNLTFVGSQIVAQTQVEKDMGPIQQICKRVGERIGLIIGFSTITGS